MTAELRESPAGQLGAACAAASVPGVVALREVPFLSQAEVRARDDAGAARVLGDLPGPGRARTDGDRTVLWCGPGWYLVVAPSPAALGLAPDGPAPGRAPSGPPAAGLVRPDVTAPGPVVSGAHGVSVTDTSAARTTLELRGPAARDVLAHGCRVDLHPRAFGPGSAVRTNLARATVVLHQVDAAPAYRMHVGASYADYLVTWLLDAMVPYVAG